jgi:two-component system response regulator
VDAAGAAVAAVTVGAPMIPKNRFVLLVDDSDDDIELALTAFEEHEIRNSIVVVRDGQEAVDYLFATGSHAARAPASMPDVVLLDLKLPKVDGLEVLRRMRADARTKRVPVVVLTSSREESDRSSSYDLGANSYVRKPVDFGRFVDVTRQIGSYWLGLNEPAPSRGSPQ